MVDDPLVGHVAGASASATVSPVAPTSPVFVTTIE